MTRVQASDAATLVLLRDGPLGPETFLSVRTREAAFMASVSVYPGGKLDPADSDPALLARLGEESLAWARAAYEDAVDPDRAAGLVVAALRESFEESGILFARRPHGEIVRWDTVEARERIDRQRRALQGRSVAFLDILLADDLVLAPEGLEYFAHWITPETRPIRFDARFFVARCPDGQEPIHDNAELVSSAWYGVREAVDLAAKGELLLMPPTLCTLDDLARHDTVDEALVWARDQTAVPICPRMELHDGSLTFLLPGDPLYPSELPVRGPTRVVLRDGGFVRE